MIAFVCGFYLVNLLAPIMMKYGPTRAFLEAVGHWKWLRGLIWNRKSQIRFTLWITIILSLAMYFTKDMVVIKEKTIYIPNFSAERGELRLAVVSDIHAGASVYRKQVEKVVDKVLDTKADAVLIVGDMVDGSVADLESRVDPFWILPHRYPTYFVTGNHEYYYGDASEWVKLYKKNGINVLENNSTMFKGVCLAGVNDISSGKMGIADHYMNVSTAIRGCPAKASRILMAHNPASVLDFPPEDLQTIDLILSGHTHAGQFYVVIPVVYWMLPYFYGLYNIAPHTQMMISAGSLYQGPPMKMLGMSECRSTKPWLEKNDDQKFSKKLMEKMGWNEGDGLGKNRQGNSNNIKLNPNVSGKGLGADKLASYDATWIACHDDFADLLNALNKNKEEDPQDETEQQKQAEKISIELKSKSLKRRIHYQKFARAKDTANHSENDKTAIFGLGKGRKAQEEELSPKKADSATSSDENEGKNDDEPKGEGNTTVSTMSVSQYFAAKMAAIKAKRVDVKVEDDGEVVVKVEETEEVVEEEDEEAVRKREKKERKRLRREQRQKEQEEEAEAVQVEVKEEVKEEEEEVVEDEEAERKRRKKEKKRARELEKVEQAEEGGEPEEEPPKKKSKKSKKNSDE
ncbi:unnamed protein product [Caenorhabditis auriculariae]|uniref:G-patch domain-containing protein n=1 Tax=Caenorhabditis auriculariae TaxID=2777116 RepID=A0A8S1H3R2_9PELO|nr:unnamed protein product [Caenorhabditis auriculariae]